MQKSKKFQRFHLIFLTTVKRIVLVLILFKVTRKRICDVVMFQVSKVHKSCRGEARWKVMEWPTTRKQQVLHLSLSATNWTSLLDGIQNIRVHVDPLSAHTPCPLILQVAAARCAPKCIIHLMNYLSSMCLCCISLPVYIFCVFFELGVLKK